MPPVGIGALQSNGAAVPPLPDGAGLPVPDVLGAEVPGGLGPVGAALGVALPGGLGPVGAALGVALAGGLGTLAAALGIALRPTLGVAGGVGATLGVTTALLPVAGLALPDGTLLTDGCTPPVAFVPGRRSSEVAAGEQATISEATIPKATVVTKELSKRMRTASIL